MTQQPQERPIGLPPRPMSYGETQQMMSAMPALFEALKKQNTAIYKAIKDQNKLLEKQLTTEENNRDWTERVHERMDALAVETRVTNYLLSELVAVHKSMITSSVESEREHIRGDAYRRILNGE